MDEEITYSTPFGRIYRIGDKCYPSVTTVLNGFNPNTPQFSNDFAVLGTRAHYELLGLYKDMEEPDSIYYKFTQDEINQKLDAAYEMWSKLDVGEVLDVEFAICDDEYQYAGRVDMLTCIDGEVVLADLKTGNYYTKYPLQLAAYYHATQHFNKYLSGAVIYQLDLSLDRNPDQEPQEIWFDATEMEEYFCKFAVKAKKYMKDQQAYIDEMTSE